MTLLSIEEAARLLGVGRRTLYRYISQDLVPCEREEGKTMIPRSYVATEEPLWSVTEVMRHFDCSRTSVDNLRRTGRLPFRLIGSSTIRYEPGEVRKLPRTTVRGYKGRRRRAY